MALAVFFLLVAMLATELAIIGLFHAAFVAVPSLVLSAALLFRVWRRRAGHHRGHRQLPVY